MRVSKFDNRVERSRRKCWGKKQTKNQTKNQKIITALQKNNNKDEKHNYNSASSVNQME